MLQMLRYFKVLKQSGATWRFVNLYIDLEFFDAHFPANICYIFFKK